jgi:hypothetical protein
LQPDLNGALFTRNGVKWKKAGVVGGNAAIKNKKDRKFMRKLFQIFGFLILAKLGAQTWASEDQYVQRFAPYAVEEMEKYKIPASITLAQGLLETAGGQSILAQQGNNHFGIKCKEDWTGKTMTHTDDAPNECFRVYEDPKQSYEDHSKFLAYRKYYVNLFRLDPKDYRAWAYGLKKDGYATNPRYANILIGKIERYHLDVFDNVDSKNVLYAILKLYPELNNDKIFMAKLGQNTADYRPQTLVVPYKPVTYAKQQERTQEIKTKAEMLNSILVRNHPNGGLKFLIVPQDMTLKELSDKFEISERRLTKWNELKSSNLKKNDIIFLESKNSSGNVDTYTTVLGDNMHSIAQKFAIKLKKLYSKNRMEDGQQPQIGQLIYLNHKKPRT